LTLFRASHYATRLLTARTHKTSSVHYSEDIAVRRSEVRFITIQIV